LCDQRQKEAPVRWNAIVDTGGTPPRLQGPARDPQKIADLIAEVAKETNCDIDVWWDRFSWHAYVTVQGRSTDPNQANADARNALAVLEATKVRQELNLKEKKLHPNVVRDSEGEGDQAPQV
jgi:hypothetical protein